MADEEVRKEIQDEAVLAELAAHPAWLIYRTRLIGRLGVIFQEFLTSSHARLPELQGAGRALWDQMETIDGSQARRVTLEREIQRRYEASVEADRLRQDMVASSSRSRFNRGPRSPGVPLG